MAPASRLLWCLAAICFARIASAQSLPYPNGTTADGGSRPGDGSEATASVLSGESVPSPRPAAGGPGGYPVCPPPITIEVCGKHCPCDPKHYVTTISVTVTVPETAPPVTETVTVTETSVSTDVEEFTATAIVKTTYTDYITRSYPYTVTVSRCHFTPGSGSPTQPPTGYPTGSIVLIGRADDARGRECVISTTTEWSTTVETSTYVTTATATVHDVSEVTVTNTATKTAVETDFETVTVNATVTDIETRTAVETDFETVTLNATVTETRTAVETDFETVTINGTVTDAETRTVVETDLETVTVNATVTDLETKTAVETDLETVTVIATVTDLETIINHDTVTVPRTVTDFQTVDDQETVTQRETISATLLEISTIVSTLTINVSFPVTVTDGQTSFLTVLTTTTSTFTSLIPLPTTVRPPPVTVTDVIPGSVNTLPGTTIVRTITSTVPPATETVTESAETFTTVLPGSVFVTTVTEVVPPTTVTEPPSVNTVATIILGEVTTCPAPTNSPGTGPATLDPSSDLTWGCKPGFVCNPPKPDSCNVWADSPADTFVCDPSDCIPAPNFPIVQWPDNETGYYPPTDGYFNLAPPAFGLSYDIFEAEVIVEDVAGSEVSVTTGNWASQTSLSHYPPDATTSTDPATARFKARADGRHAALSKRDATVCPAICYDTCNNCYLEAQNVGKTPALCAPKAPFREYYDACQDCIARNSPDVKVTTRVYLEPKFSQFLKYCDAQAAQPQLSSSSAGAEPQPQQTKPPTVETTSQAPPNTNTAAVPIAATSTVEGVAVTSTEEAVTVETTNAPTSGASGGEESAASTGGGQTTGGEGGGGGGGTGGGAGGGGETGGAGAGGGGETGGGGSGGGGSGGAAGVTSGEPSASPTSSSPVTAAALKTADASLGSLFLFLLAAVWFTGDLI
ncbi:hypothetical protein VTK73DRAFT_5248 [Phialemonium thermophilum]|uniref:Glycoprotein X n=1 Tax=Phialemonium thermophilum TaxID=223376 RepID=A0ABR3WP32_9PEZI